MSHLAVDQPEAVPSADDIVYDLVSVQYHALKASKAYDSYVQDAEGVVHVVLREDPGADACAALDTEAERLTGWLAGESVNSVYASRQMREARLP